MNPTRAAVLLLLGVTAASAGEPSAPRPRATDRLGITYSPPPATPRSEPEAHNADTGSLVILPQLDVRVDRIDLDEHEILTSKGALELAKKRHLSPFYRKTLGPLSLVATLAADPLLILRGARANDIEARTLYAEEQRVRRRTETAELIELIDDVDPTLSKDLRRSTATSFRNPTALGERRRE